MKAAGNVGSPLAADLSTSEARPGDKHRPYMGTLSDHARNITSSRLNIFTHSASATPA